LPKDDPLAFSFHTKPRAHQLREFELHKDKRLWALFHEQRTGKTKITLDTAAYRYWKGDIDTLLVIAPSGVHYNWIAEECPRHLHPLTHPSLICWRGNPTKTWTTQFQAALKKPGLLVFSMNIEAIITKAGKNALAAIFHTRKAVMSVIDESQMIKKPGAKRTPVIRRIAARSIIRRILTGTPVTQSPLDLYNQMRFLDWRILGFNTHAEFKAHYAEWETEYNGRTETEYTTLKNYKNLDEMKARLAGYSSRVTRAECADLPPKIYAKHYFPLTPMQRRVYDTLREQYIAEIREKEYTVLHALTRLMRLQQVASNFFPIDQEVQTCPHCTGSGCEQCDGGYWLPPTAYQSIDTKNPRLEALRTILEEEQPDKVVIWARFNKDIDDIIALLTTVGRGRPCRYDGTVPQKIRGADLKGFQDGTIRDLVSKPQSGGRGIDMSMSRLEIFFTNQYSLEARMQAEDRLETVNLGMGSTSIIDLVAQDTVDEKIVTVLREKKHLADLITGDKFREWL
jgi:SNF2 family DNA or RNA helicase